MLRVFIRYFVWYSFWVLYESIVWMEDLCLKNKILLRENFHDHKKAFACGKRRPWSRKKPWLVETFLGEEIIFVWGKFSWGRKNLDLWKKTSSIKENSLLVGNFLEEGKIFAYGKLPWWRKSLHLLKAPLMNRISLLEENVLDEWKIFDCGKCPWWRRTLGIWWLPWWRKHFHLYKISMMKKILACWKALLLWKNNSSKSFENEAV